jgi:two-component system, chemotaxis family, chemotaxis protein CheY
MLDRDGRLFSDQENMAVAKAARPIKPRLLVIDDETLHRMIICRVAAKAGYAPAGAASFDEAAKLLRETAFDCVTLDLSLGPDAGFEMLRHLSFTGSAAPIIVISGCDPATRGETVKTARSFNLNVWQAMPKPVDLAVLRYWLERLKSDREIAAAAA